MYYSRAVRFSSFVRIGLLIGLFACEAILLAACQSGNSVLTLSPKTEFLTITLSPDSSGSETAPPPTERVETPQSLVSPSPTFHLEFPATPESQPTTDFTQTVLGEDLLSLEVDDCVLPCWHHLRLGISHAASVETTLRDILELPEDYQFAKTEYESSYSISYIWDATGENQWFHDFEFWSGFDKNDDSLSRLYIYTTDSQLLSQAAPQLILETLGLPTNAYARLYEVGYPGTAIFDLRLVYLDVGVEYTISTRIQTDNYDNYPYMAQWCYSGGNLQEWENLRLVVLPPYDSYLAETWVLEEYEPFIDITGEQVEDSFQDTSPDQNNCLYLEF
jgi:hypothetical protein